MVLQFQKNVQQKHMFKIYKQKYIKNIKKKKKKEAKQIQPVNLELVKRLIFVVKTNYPNIENYTEKKQKN